MPNGDTRRLTFIRQRTAPMDIQGHIHLGKGKVRSIPLESRRSIGCSLGAVFLLEGGVVSTPFKEIEKCPIEMTKRLLQRNRRDFVEPCMVILFFELGQSLAHLLIVHALSLPIVGIGSLAQRPIVDVATTTEGLSKHLLLLIGGLYAVLVGFL